MKPFILRPEKLTREAFAPFGDVISIEGVKPLVINEGYTERYHDLGRLELAQQNGHPLVNIFHSKPKSYPARIEFMERHPLGSQAFIPLCKTPFLVLVALASSPPLHKEDLRLFITNGGQGINYRPNVWHHYSLVLAATYFVVIDRGGEGPNLEEYHFPMEEFICIDLN
ncbi:MAG: ureidoglycolate lyase [Deinococcales bacterium]